MIPPRIFQSRRRIYVVSDTRGFKSLPQLSVEGRFLRCILYLFMCCLLLVRPAEADEDLGDEDSARSKRWLDAGPSGRTGPFGAAKSDVDDILVDSFGCARWPAEACDSSVWRHFAGFCRICAAKARRWKGVQVLVHAFSLRRRRKHTYLRISLTER